MKSDFLTIAFRRLRARFRRTNDSGEDDDDALQEAFCRLWEGRVGVTDVAHAEGLLVKTTHNIRIDKFRKRSSYPTVNLSEVNDSSWIPNEDNLIEIYNQVTQMAMKYLTDRDREILYKRDRDGITFAEIAKEYDLSEANVRLIVSRARKTLREIYRKNKDFNV
ncbi:MAG: sigma-70 family RNA polymerase sigma factor [Bacteroides sp.]|nr:sigma-70 family RNA polymerase sigma factor [Bacteroides sp.]